MAMAHTPPQFNSPFSLSISRRSDQIVLKAQLPRVLGL